MNKPILLVTLDVVKLPAQIRYKSLFKVLVDALDNLLLVEQFLNQLTQIVLLVDEHLENLITQSNLHLHE